MPGCTLVQSPSFFHKARGPKETSLSDLDAFFYLRQTDPRGWTPRNDSAGHCEIFLQLHHGFCKKNPLGGQFGAAPPGTSFQSDALEVMTPKLWIKRISPILQGKALGNMNTWTAVDASGTSAHPATMPGSTATSRPVRQTASPRLFPRFFVRCHGIVGTGHHRSFDITALLTPLMNFQKIPENGKREKQVMKKWHIVYF